MKKKILAFFSDDFLAKKNILRYSSIFGDEENIYCLLLSEIFSRTQRCKVIKKHDYNMINTGAYQLLKTLHVEVDLEHCFYMQDAFIYRNSNHLS